MKRILPVILVVVVLIISLTTCHSKTDDPVSDSTPTPTVSETPEPTETVTAEPTPSETPYNGPVNPLTGLPVDEDISAQRPFAIMLDNYKGAQPQIGISQADLIYEALAEGGITRIMAVFQDVSDVGVIGSVRSSRHYFIDLAQGLDAIYIHAGGSDQAYAALYSRNIDHLDGVNGGKQNIFYRDSARKASMGFEHSLMTSGDLISQYVPTYNMRMQHKDGYTCNLTFTDDGTPPGGSPAEDVTVHYSSGKTTDFSYSSDDGLYYISQYGSAYVDGGNDEQVAVTNVFVLFASVTAIPGDTKGRLDTDLTGSGSGYYICGGKAVEIKWSKDRYESQFTFTYADGTGFDLGRGKSYIGIVPKNNAVNIA